MCLNPDSHMLVTGTEQVCARATLSLREDDGKMMS